MTPERARTRYQAAWSNALHHDWCALYRTRTRRRSCELADGYWLRVDAASIQLDLATAEDCARKSVAWA